MTSSLDPDRRSDLNRRLDLDRRLDFDRRLAGFGDSEALLAGSSSLTYRELLRSVDDLRSRFASAGIGPGSVVALAAAPLSLAVPGLLALARLQAVVLPLPTTPPRRVAEMLEVGQAEWTVGALRPEPAETAADVVVEKTGRTAVHPLYDRLRERGSAGLVLFSSGTTGRSKATLLDLDALLDRASTSRPPHRTLSFLGLDHIGGVNTLLHSLATGGTLVSTPGRTPDEVFAVVERDRVSILPTTPTFLTMALISGAHLRHDTSSLSLITYGTEPMPQHTLEKLSRDLPSTRLKQTYGLSELGILATRSKAVDSPWLQLGGDGFDVKIVDGILRIKSPTAMLGYLNADAPFDDDGYFDTRDAVEVDGEYVRILGRASEIINVGGEKVYPNEVESVLLELDNVAEVTVSARRSPVTGEVVQATVTLVEPEDPRSLRRRVDQHCAARLEPFKVPAAVVVAEGVQHGDRFKKLRAS